MKGKHLLAIGSIIIAVGVLTNHFGVKNDFISGIIFGIAIGLIITGILSLTGMLKGEN